MTSNKLAPINNLAYALNLIKFLPQALHHHVADLSSIRQQITQLDGRTCTGNVHWRDKDKPGKTAKLYILHRTDETCPIHGQPEPGCRHRIYIGNKPDRISDALAAIERSADRADLQRRCHRLDSSISRLTYQLQALYRILGHYPPDPREQRPAMPMENV